MNHPQLEKYIHDIPDFPRSGIIFKDLSPLLASCQARDLMTEKLAEPFLNQQIDIVVGIESRGFLFGMLLANALNAKFVMMRKPGKLPGEVLTHQYDLEYGSDALEIQKNSIQTNDQVLIHDDVLATGGTAAAAAYLISQMGAEVIGHSFVLAIDLLKGAEKISSPKIHSVLHY